MCKLRYLIGRSANQVSLVNNCRMLINYPDFYTVACHYYNLNGSFSVCCCFRPVGASGDCHAISCKYCVCILYFMSDVCVGVAGEATPVTSEQEVFDIIGMKYKRPDERNM